MDGVNRKVVGAFAGIMLAVALTLLNVWQLGLAVLAVNGSQSLNKVKI